MFKTKIKKMAIIIIQNENGWRRETLGDDLEKIEREYIIGKSLNKLTDKLKEWNI